MKDFMRDTEKITVIDLNIPHKDIMGIALNLNPKLRKLFLSCDIITMDTNSLINGYIDKNLVFQAYGYWSICNNFICRSITFKIDGYKIHIDDKGGKILND